MAISRVTKNGKRLWLNDRYVNGERVRSFSVDHPGEEKRSTIVDIVNKFVEQTFEEKSVEGRYNERGHLKEFFEFCAKENISYADQVKTEHLIAFRKTLQVSNTTANRKLTTIRSMFSVAFKKKLIPENPGKEMGLLEDDSSERTPWNEEHLAQVLGHPETQDWVRDYLMGLWLTGMRPTQLGSLKFSDIDWQTGRMQTQSKKGRHRKYELPIHSDFADLVRRRYTKFGHLTDWIFVNSRGRKVTKDCLYQAVTHITKKLGLNHLTPYGLRHGFGTNLACENVHLATISRLMGHTKLETTLRYCRPDDKQLRKALKLVRGGKAI